MSDETLAPDGATGQPSGETVTGSDQDATTPESAPATHPAAEPDRGPFFTGIWQGRPLYRCPLCGVARTDREGLSGDAAIRIHLERNHRSAPSVVERAHAAGLVIPKR